MIYDRFENAKNYVDLDSPIYKAICFARDAAAKLEDGTHELDGERLKACIGAYQTERADERRFEGHRKYIDVQVMMEGVERQDVSVSSDLIPEASYDAGSDLIFFETPGHFTSVYMAPGYFVVYFPQDAHRPNCAVDGTPAAVRKVCMKIIV